VRLREAMATRKPPYLLVGGAAAGLALYLVWQRRKTAATSSVAAGPPAALQHEAKSSGPEEEKAQVAPLKVGDTAEALYKYGRKWYAVTVRAVNADGSYALDYEDGDFWDHVSASGAAL